MGSTGSRGFQGYTGSQGNTGYVGSLGYTGSAGAGYTGSQGEAGYSGSLGNTGYTGSKGERGEAGGNANTANFVFTASQMSVTTNDDITVVTNGNTWTFGANGTLSLPTSSNDLYTTTNALIKSFADIQIAAGDDVGSNWIFGGDGTLTFPNGNLTISNDSIVGSIGTIVSVLAEGRQGAVGIQWVDDISSLGSTTTQTQVAGVGVNTPFSSTTGTVQIVTGFTTGTTVSNIWEFGTDGSLTAPGHLLPDADLEYDLGSTSSQWRSIYVGTGTVYIGGVALGVNQDNYVTVDGNPIITVNTSGNLTIQGDTNVVLGAVIISDTSPAATTPGSQWYNSLDGRTYIAYNGQWVDASPTVVPTPETYLGNITIDGDTLNINGGTLTISNTGTLLVNGAEVTGSSGGGDRLVNGDYEVVLDQDGVLNLPRRGAIRNLSGTYDVNVVGAGPNGFAQLQWTTLAGAAEADPNGTDELKHWLYIEEPGVFIETNVNGSGDSYEWKFGTDGSLEFPEGAAISSVMGVFRLTPPAASTETQALLIYPTVQDGNHIHLTAGGGETDLYLGNDNQYVKVDHSGDIVVGTYSTATTTSTWVFGTDGSTKFPNDTILGTGQDPNVYIETATTTTTSTWTFGTNGILTLPAATPIIKGGGTGTDVTVVATTGSNTATWVFAADSSITFPDATVQRTAYPTGQQTVYLNTASTATSIDLTDITVPLFIITTEEGYITSGETHYITLPIGFEAVLAVGTKVRFINNYNGIAEVSGWPGFGGYQMAAGETIELIYYYTDGGYLWRVINTFLWD